MLQDLHCMDTEDQLRKIYGHAGLVALQSLE